MEGGLPGPHHFGQRGGIGDGLPAPAFHLFGAGAGVFVPALVVPEDPTVAIGHPAKLGDRIGQAPEQPLAFAPGLFGPAAAPHFPGQDGDPDQGQDQGQRYGRHQPGLPAQVLAGLEDHLLGPPGFQDPIVGPVPPDGRQGVVDVLEQAGIAFPGWD